MTDDDISPAVAKKAAALLTEGKVQILEISPNGIRAEVAASQPGDPYRLRYDKANGWMCDCAARVAKCSHIVALRSVVHPDSNVFVEFSQPVPALIPGFEKAETLDEFLNGFA